MNKLYKVKLNTGKPAEKVFNCQISSVTDKEAMDVAEGMWFSFSLLWEHPTVKLYNPEGKLVKEIK